jgi:hypothetical protein
MKGERVMAILITHEDGSTEIISEAVRVDEQNFHEGMYDFYDERGNLLRQIDMHSKIKWKLVEGPLEREAELPLFLRNSAEGRKGNAQDEKDGTGE